MNLKNNVYLHGATTGELLGQAHNITVDGGFNWGLEMWFATTASILTYCAIGTATTAPASTNTTLGVETYRNPFTSAPAILNNQATVQTYFYKGDCGVGIQELGIFGDGATATTGSGTMFARVLLAYSNSASPVDLVVTWVVTIS